MPRTRKVSLAELVPPIKPIQIPLLDISSERIDELLRQLEPLPPTIQPIVSVPMTAESTDVSSNHLQIDRNFVAMLEELKPSEVRWAQPNFMKPGVTASERETKKYHADRMREYRRRSSEQLEKTKLFVGKLKNQLALNTLLLKRMMNLNTLEDEVKKSIAQFLEIDVEKVLDIPEVEDIFRNYRHRRKVASESHFELKSLFYLDRVVTFRRDLALYKKNNSLPRCTTKLNKKIKDAEMKAEAYKHFMDDKRVQKVITSLNKNEENFKLSINQYLNGQRSFGDVDNSS